MGRFGRHLKPIARLQRAGRLAFYGKIKATFEDIAGLDSRMRRATVTPGSISASTIIVT
jgi:hypothetical protein